MKIITLKILLSIPFFMSVTMGTLVFADTPIVDERPALPFPPGISVESQCGQVNDQQDVELYDGTLGVSKLYVQNYEESTVQLQWQDSGKIGAKLPNYSQGNIAGERWCSGTLISDDLILTAAHCFEVQTGLLTGWVTPFVLDADGNKIFAEPTILATLQQINFKFQVDVNTGKERSPTVYPIEELVEYGRDLDGNLDYAIVKVGRNTDGTLPGETFTPAAVDVRDAKVGEDIAIIQHPQGKPKKIEAGNATQVDASDLYYNDIDTHGGSSGSAVRDVDGEVVGVHTNGGCSVNSGANRGEPISAISKVSAIF